jgi:hypothetical protein
MEETSSDARGATSGFELSPYFKCFRWLR